MCTVILLNYNELQGLAAEYGDKLKAKTGGNKDLFLFEISHSGFAAVRNDMFFPCCRL